MNENSANDILVATDEDLQDRLAASEDGSLSFEMIRAVTIKAKEAESAARLAVSACDRETCLMRAQAFETAASIIEQVSSRKAR